MIGQRFKRFARTKQALLLLITILIIIGFYINNKYYLSLDTIRGTMQAMSLTGIMAVGVACLLIGGGMDLSMSMVSIFGGIMCAKMIAAGVPWGFAIVLTLILGACVGAVNAFLVAKLNLMPFIATIAVSNVIQGLNLGSTNAQNIQIKIESFYWGSRTLFGIFPYPFVIMVVLLTVYGLILSKTQFGRNIYLVGGNMAAARLSGINPVKIRSVLFINCGVMAALSGIVLASRMHSAIPTSLSDSQMDAITAAILGGVAFSGDAGGMASCFMGIVMLNFFNTGLNSLGIEAYWSTIASGLLLLIALAMDFVSQKARIRALKAKTEPVAKGV